MTWQEQGGISEVFWTTDTEFAFQRVGNSWNLYWRGIEHTKNFRSFAAMQEYIRKEREKDDHK